MQSLTRSLAVIGAAAVLIVPMAIALSSHPVPPVTPSPQFVPSPAASPMPVGSSAVHLLSEQLIQPGQAVTIDAVDGLGVWGAIDLTRGPDTGGYVHYAVPPDAFVIEIQIEYRANRVPNVNQSGSFDWTLTTAHSADPVGQQLEVPPPFEAVDWGPERQTLIGGYSLLVDVLTVPVRGTLYFQVPRDVVDRELTLLYRPQGFTTPVVKILVREPSPAPDPVPTATPVPAPQTLAYVHREGMPFTIIENAAADALFANPDVCINQTDGFRLTFPDIWYTNTQVGDVRPCTWFSPAEFVLPTAVRPPPPDGVVITVEVLPGGFGWYYQPTFTVDDVISIDGFEGWRREEVAGCFPGYGCRALPPTYTYAAPLGKHIWDRTMLAVTSSEGVPNYDLNKAVLDRIMASIEFLP
jgi:hypothetical protein